MLERVLVDEAIEVLCQGIRHFRWATRAGAIHQALYPLVGKAMDPFPQRAIGKVERVRDGLEAVPCDDVTHSLGTPEDTGLLCLFQQGC
jgi:hypothetical protein